jgi:lycopene beta-cyclase
MTASLPRATHHDVIIVGGGLAGQLCALAIRAVAPTLSVALVERSSGLGGNHTWCCHGSDLTADDARERERMLAWLLPLVDARWSRHRVRFPGFARQLDGEYLCIRSASLARISAAALNGSAGTVLTGRTVLDLDRHTVRTTEGEELRGSVVLDARGDDPSSYDGRTGFQKFLGWEIELASAASPRFAVPILMDATVAQTDGFRFVYVLPFSSSRLLVEDTYFSRTGTFDARVVRARLGDYLRANGITDFAVVREEAGALPMPWGRPRRPVDDTLAVGYRGGFFQPATGYSLGRAARVAHRIARVLQETSVAERTHAVHDALTELRDHWTVDDRFARLLNRLAFTLVPPTWLRQHVFARVYRLPQVTLDRFYAGRTSLRDRLALATAPLRIPIAFASKRHVPLLGENP